MDLDTLQLSSAVRGRMRSVNEEYLEIAQRFFNRTLAAAPLLGLARTAAQALGNTAAAALRPMCRMDFLVATLRVTKPDFWLKAAEGTVDPHEVRHAFSAHVPATAFSSALRARVRRWNEEYVSLARLLARTYPAPAPFLGIAPQAAAAFAKVNTATLEPLCRLDFPVGILRMTSPEFWARALAGTLDTNHLLHAYMSTMPAEDS